MEVHVRQIVSMLWWVLLVKGLAALVFGLAAVFWTGMTLVALVYLFSAYIIVSGILGIILGVFSAGRSGMWLLGLIVGILELGVGIYAVRNPQITLGVFVLLIGFTFIFRGILQIVAAFMEAAPDGAGRALLVISGVLSAIAGILIVMQPVAGGLAFVWALGVYLLVVGSMDIARAAAAKTMLDHLLQPRQA